MSEPKNDTEARAKRVAAQLKSFQSQLAAAKQEYSDLAGEYENRAKNAEARLAEVSAQLENVQEAYRECCLEKVEAANLVATLRAEVERLTRERTQIIELKNKALDKWKEAMESVERLKGERDARDIRKCSLCGSDIPPAVETCPYCRGLEKQRDVRIEELVAAHGTEQTMHNAWRKRAEEAETALSQAQQALVQAAIPLEAILAAVDWELSPVVMKAVKEGVEAIRAALPSDALPSSELNLPCLACGKPKSDSTMHHDAPGKNWGAALHWFEAPPSDAPERLKEDS